MSTLSRLAALVAVLSTAAVIAADAPAYAADCCVSATARAKTGADTAAAAKRPGYLVTMDKRAVRAASLPAAPVGAPGAATCCASTGNCCGSSGSTSCCTPAASRCCTG